MPFLELTINSTFLFLLGDDELCDFCPSEFATESTANFKKKENTERVQPKLEGEFGDIVKTMLKNYFQNKKKKLEDMKHNKMHDKSKNLEDQNGEHSKFDQNEEQDKASEKMSEGKSTTNMETSDDDNNTGKSNSNADDAQSLNFLKHKKKVDLISSKAFESDDQYKSNKSGIKSKKIKNQKSKTTHDKSSSDIGKEISRLEKEATKIEKKIQNGMKEDNMESYHGNSKLKVEENLENSFRPEYKLSLTEYDDDKDSKVIKNKKGKYVRVNV